MIKAMLLDVGDTFVHVETSQPRKVFEAALDQLGVCAEDAMFVGDRVDKDVKGAADVGMKTVLMAHNGNIPGGRPRPDHTIRCLSELLPLIEA